jgi:hypothetical protein
MIGSNAGKTTHHYRYGEIHANSGCDETYAHRQELAITILCLRKMNSLLAPEGSKDLVLLIILRITVSVP